MTKRIMVTLDDEQYKILQSLKGFGTKNAEKLRNIFIAYVSEKSYVKESQKDDSHRGGRWTQKMKALIEEAKRNMYTEEWERAKKCLQSAKLIAISLRDKNQIDEILSLIEGCEKRVKPEL